jgi:2-amino-4-hydroxy-6-hydroxymethyldihydropteridine diphosphokinase
MYNQHKPLHTAFIAMGSNLADRWNFLRQGVTALAELSATPVLVSSVYETNPVDYLDQPRFLNLVARIEVGASPRTLLAELHRIEDRCERVRDVRYGPRTLDLDILLYDNDYVCFADLQIPHPRMWQRAFVLVPLAGLAPYRRCLGGLTVQQLANMERQKEGIQHVGNLWATT